MLPSFRPEPLQIAFGAWLLVLIAADFYLVYLGKKRAALQTVSAQEKSVEMTVDNEGVKAPLKPAPVGQDSLGSKDAGADPVRIEVRPATPPQQ